MSRIVLPEEPLLDPPTALRPWRESDVPALVRICRDDDIVRWTSVPPNYAEADARIYLLRRHDAILTGTAAPFAIVLDPPDDSGAARSGEAGTAGEARGRPAGGKPEQQLIGSISLVRIAWDQRRAEVGYFLSRDARGAGHATRAVGLICRWAFRSLGIERIDLYAATENLPSQRVAERCGFEREAVLRSFMRGKGIQLDMVAFGLLDGESEIP